MSMKLLNDDVTQLFGFAVTIALGMLVISCDDPSTNREVTSINRGERLEEIKESKLAGKKFVSRNGEKLGMDSDAEIIFEETHRVEVSISGIDFVTYTGNYSLLENGKIVIDLTDYPEKWPEMVLESKSGVDLLHRKDGVTSMKPELSGVKEFENFWPFSEERK